MKYSFLVFLSIYTVSLFGQHSILESKNLLLIHPDAIEQLTPSIVNHFESNYYALRSELETELNATRLGKNLETLEKDLETLTVCLENWEWAKSEDKSLEFITNYDSNNCYEVFSKEGDPVIEFDLIETENTEINFVHTQKLYKLIRKAKYIRKKDPNCKSPQEKDCYIACLQEYPPLYEMTSSGRKISFEEIPNNCQLDQDNMELIYEVNLQATHKIII